MATCAKIPSILLKWPEKEGRAPYWALRVGSNIRPVREVSRFIAAQPQGNHKILEMIMTKTEFFEMLGAPLKNFRWSWGAVRHEDGVVFLRVWQDEIKHRDGTKCVQVPNNENFQINPSTGNKERFNHIKLIKKGARCYLIMCEAADEDKRRIQSFDKDQVFLGGHLERWEEDYWIELCSPVPVYQVMLPFRLPEEVPTGPTYSEGSVQKILVNQYERNPKARKSCIAHYGSTCVVCHFNFGQVYGSLAEGFIHVHHLKKISEIGEKYEIDPIADLRPVCPNCPCGV